MKQIIDKDSGIDYEAMEAALVQLEPARRTAASATLNSSIGLCLSILMLLQSADTFSIGWSLALLPAIIILPMSVGLWRSIAISAMAPVAAEKWGQKELVAGIAAMEWQDLLGLVGSNSYGNAYARWKGTGTYRGTQYRAQETIFHRKRRPKQHFLAVEVGLDKNTSGIIEITSKTWGIGHLDALIRSLESETQRTYVDPSFDSVFDIFAPHHVDARVVLTADLRRTLIAIQSQLRPNPFFARIEHGWLFMQIRIDGPSLQSASLWQETSKYINGAKQLWWELTFPHRVIDTIKGDHDGRLH